MNNNETKQEVPQQEEGRINSTRLDDVATVFYTKVAEAAHYYFEHKSKLGFDLSKTGISLDIVPNYDKDISNSDKTKIKISLKEMPLEDDEINNTKKQ